MIDRFEQFVSVISGIHRDIQKIERAEMVRYGLKGSYAQYFVALYRCPQGMTAARLGEICDKDKAAVSRAVNELEAKGLLRRQGDSYRALLVLTEPGREAAAYVVEKAAAAARIAGQALDEETRATLYTALRGISGRLQEICRDGLPNEKENNP